MPVLSQDLDFQCHMSWSFLCLMNLGERSLLVLLILLESLTWHKCSSLTWHKCSSLTWHKCSVFLYIVKIVHYYMFCKWSNWNEIIIYFFWFAEPNKRIPINNKYLHLGGPSWSWSYGSWIFNYLGYNPTWYIHVYW